MHKSFIFVLEKMFVITTPLFIFLIVLLGGYLFRRVLFRRLGLWADKTETQIDDIIIRALRGPFIVWTLMLGIYFAFSVSNLPLNLVNLINKILVILGIFSVTLVFANIVTNFINVYTSKVQTIIPLTSLTQNISRIVIFIIGFLIILNSLGITIVPILATLGVGGLAVALALQDTLSNLFAGFYLVVAKQIKIGDYIKLDSGEEGYVIDITWRTTKIKMLPNNIILVPNEKLTKAIVTNFYLPDREISVLVNIGVHYKSDLEKVERVTCEVAKEVMREVKGGVPDFEPFIRYHTLGDFSVNFTAILRVREFSDQYLIKHEFIKRLHKRYAKEGIVVPYPIYAINYSQEKAAEVIKDVS